VLNILPTEIEYEDDEAEDVLEVVGQVEEEVEAVVALFALIRILILRIRIIMCCIRILMLLCSAERYCGH